MSNENGTLEFIKVTIEKQFTFESGIYNLLGNAHYDAQDNELKDFSVSVNKTVSGQEYFIGNANGWMDNGVVKVNTSNIPLEDSTAVAAILQDLVSQLTNED